MLCGAPHNAGYEPVLKLGQRVEAGCLVHARRKFEELIKNGHASPVAEEAMRRLGWIFWIEKQARDSSPADRLAIRQDQTRGHWDKLHGWLRTERALVPDGSGIAAAIDYSLNRWTPLGRFLEDGNVSCHNHHLEMDEELFNLIGRKELNLAYAEGEAILRSEASEPWKSSSAASTRC